MLFVPIISIFAVWLFSTLGVSTTSAFDAYKGIKLLILFFAPGYYFALLVGKKMRLTLDEILAIDVLISIALATLASIYLSFPLTQITDSAVSIGLLVTTLLSALVCLPNLLEEDELGMMTASSNNPMAAIGLALSILIGFLLIVRVIPSSYWRGWDPWLNAPVTRMILEEGYNPSELVKIGLGNVGNSGFYYFLAFVEVFTGIDSYTLTRFGGPILAGLGSGITYLIFRKLEGASAGLLASLFLSLNPFYVKRFSMALRENFSWVFLLAVLFLFVIRRQKQKMDRISRFSYICSIGLYSAIAFISHSLTLIIICGIIFLEIIFFLFEKKRDHALELLLALSFSILIITPYIKIILSMFSWVMIHQIPMEAFISFFILISFLIGFLIFNKQFKRLDKYMRTGCLILAIVLFIGAINAVLFPKTFPILGSYNPPITRAHFAISILPLALFGIFNTFWVSLSITLMSFSFITVLIMNVQNFNIAFPLFRLIIYISWLLSYAAVRGLKSIYYFLEKSKKYFPIHIKIFKRMFIIKKRVVPLFSYIVMLLLVSPMIMADFQVINKAYSYYTDEDVDSAQKFITILKENDIVIPQAWAQGLLHYVGIDVGKMMQGPILQELYSTNNIVDFSHTILTKYPNISRAYIFMIQRKIGRKDFPNPSLRLLEEFGEKHQIGSIVFYPISLPIRLEENELLESPIRIQLPSGPQWVKYNITGIDLNQSHSLNIQILNKNTSKTFFIRLIDIYGGLTEKKIFMLENGTEIYQISLNNLREGFDLRNASNIVFCFSWWDEFKINLTITRITLISRK